MERSHAIQIRASKRSSCASGDGAPTSRAHPKRGRPLLFDPSQYSPATSSRSTQVVASRAGKQRPTATILSGAPCVVRAEVRNGIIVAPLKPPSTTSSRIDEAPEPALSFLVNRWAWAALQETRWRLLGNTQQMDLHATRHDRLEEAIHSITGLRVYGDWSCPDERDVKMVINYLHWWMRRVRRGEFASEDIPWADGCSSE